MPSPITAELSLASSFNRLSNSHFEAAGQRLAFESNITPTKPRCSEQDRNNVAEMGLPSFSGVTEPLPNSSLECDPPDSQISRNGVDCVSINDSDSASTNDDQPLHKAKEKTTSSSKRKKTKRVPLMTISNHARMNTSAEKVKSHNKSAPNFDTSRFDKRFGEAPDVSGFSQVNKTAGCSEKSDHVVTPSVGFGNFFERSGAATPSLSSSETSKPAVIMPQKRLVLTPSKNTDSNISPVVCTSSKASKPAVKTLQKRLILTPAKDIDSSTSVQHSGVRRVIFANVPAQNSEKSSNPFQSCVVQDTTNPFTGASEQDSNSFQSSRAPTSASTKFISFGSEISGESLAPKGTERRVTKSDSVPVRRVILKEVVEKKQDLPPVQAKTPEKEYKSTCITPTKHSEPTRITPIKHHQPVTTTPVKRIAVTPVKSGTKHDSKKRVMLTPAKSSNSSPFNCAESSESNNKEMTSDKSCDKSSFSADENERSIVHTVAEVNKCLNGDF